MLYLYSFARIGSLADRTNIPGSAPKNYLADVQYHYQFISAIVDRYYEEFLLDSNYGYLLR